MIDNYIVRRPKVCWNACFNLKATVYRSLLQLTGISQKEGKIVGKKRERYDEVFVDIGNASSKENNTFYEKNRTHRKHPIVQNVIFNYTYRRTESF